MWPPRFRVGWSSLSATALATVLPCRAGTSCRLPLVLEDVDVQPSSASEFALLFLGDAGFCVHAPARTLGSVLQEAGVLDLDVKRWTGHGGYLWKKKPTI